MVCIGIDLGTTYSCVSIWQNNNAEIIANDQGNRTTPSYVSFSGEERQIGAAAKSQSAQNAKNTVFDAKRLIGRKFKDEEVQKELPHLPYKVLENNKIDKIEIITGVRKDGNLEVVEGLEENDRIVKEGLSRLNKGMSVRPIVK